MAIKIRPANKKELLFGDPSAIKKSNKYLNSIELGKQLFTYDFVDDYGSSMIQLFEKVV